MSVARTRSLATAGALAVLCSPAASWAGGFEFPGNGTEALGRGGAFTAKADSPLALEYNVAGLAQQRGTRLLFDSNLHFGSYTFQRAGDYRLVSDEAHKPFYAPFLGVSSDFGYFDRWTFAVGAFGPSSIGKRSYPVGDDRLGPARYDVVSTDTLILLPTVAAAVKINRYFDLGLGLSLAFGTFKLSNATVLPKLCTGKVLSDPTCDYTTQIDVKTSVNPLLSVGLLLHPVRTQSAAVDVGIHVRSGANLGAKPITGKGNFLVTDPKGGEVGAGVVEAEFDANLPWIFRGGVRYAYVKAAREIFDLEADLTYEAWSLSEGEGSRLRAENPLNPNNPDIALNVLLPHYYKDTFSLRLGGAFNQPIGPVAATFRLGFYYDSSATDSSFTRLDFNTLAKVAATLGAGVTYRGATLNLAYAFIHSLERTVTDGQLIAIDGGNGKPAMDGMQLTPAVNNGTYNGTNHLLSLGLLLQFDELIRGDAWTRRPHPHQPPTS